MFTACQNHGIKSKPIFHEVFLNIVLKNNPNGTGKAFAQCILDGSPGI